MEKQCSAEEYRNGMIREEAHACHWRPNCCKQFTHCLLKKYRPGAEKTQLLGVANTTKKNYPKCIKDTTYSEFEKFCRVVQA